MLVCANTDGIKEKTNKPNKRKYDFLIKNDCLIYTLILLVYGVTGNGIGDGVPSTIFCTDLGNFV